MSEARAEVLARIAAIARAAAPEARRAYRVAGTRSPDEVVQLFCARVADYRAEVLRVPAASVAVEVERVVAAHGAARVGVPSGLRAEWRPQGCTLVAEEKLDTAGFDTLDGALTGSTTAIAETGTIVLACGPEEGRRALTLVPDLHVCVVERGDIVELVPEAMRRVGELVRAERRPLTLVSGPSATSDIELRRVEGVHGPRRLVVIVAE
jgi:L-lactate dehydrogenase complex protein LldG